MNSNPTVQSGTSVKFGGPVPIFGGPLGEGGPDYEPPTDATDALLRWWVDDAADEAERTAAKKAEYGSLDLVHLGQTLRRLQGRPEFDDPREAMEHGCLMYVLGKVERMVEAAAQGRQIQEDSWFDLAVYAKMARAVRSGAWRL